MDALSLAAVLDVMSKIGVVGVSGLFLWLMFTDRLQTKGHVDELKADCEKELTEKNRLIARLDQRLFGIENSLVRMGAPFARPPSRSVPELEAPDEE